MGDVEADARDGGAVTQRVRVVQQGITAGPAIRVGIVELSPSQVLEWLQLQGGAILGVELSVNTGLIRLRIAHPDFPEVPDGQTAQPVFLSFWTTHHECGHQTVRRVGPDAAA